MATAAQTDPALLTAEEFACRPDLGLPEEQVKGRIVATPLPRARHGQVCNKVGVSWGTSPRTMTSAMS